MKHIATAIHEISCSTISAHAVKTIVPPMVRFADHRFESPLVLKISVTSKPDNSLTKWFFIRSFPFFDSVACYCRDDGINESENLLRWMFGWD